MLNSVRIIPCSYLCLDFGHIYRVSDVTIQIRIIILFSLGINTRQNLCFVVFIVRYKNKRIINLLPTDAAVERHHLGNLSVVMSVRCHVRNDRLIHTVPREAPFRHGNLRYKIVRVDNVVNVGIRLRLCRRANRSVQSHRRLKTIGIDISLGNRNLGSGSYLSGRSDIPCKKIYRGCSTTVTGHPKFNFAFEFVAVLCDIGIQENLSYILRVSESLMISCQANLEVTRPFILVSGASGRKSNQGKLVPIGLDLLMTDDNAHRIDVRNRLKIIIYLNVIKFAGLKQFLCIHRFQSHIGCSLRCIRRHGKAHRHCRKAGIIFRGRRRKIIVLKVIIR